MTQEATVADVGAPTPSELKGAPMATLEAVADSPEACALVDRLIELIDEYLAVAGEAKRKSVETALNARRRAAGALVADLMRHTKTENDPGMAYRSMRSNAFTKAEITYTAFKHVTDGLGGLGLIKKYRGFSALTREFDWGDGVRSKEFLRKAARFQATPALLGLAKEAGVHLDSLRHHFRRPLPRTVVSLKTKSEWVWGTKTKGEPIDLPPGPKLDAITEQVHQLNRYLADIRIDGGHHDGFQRMYSMGDQPEFNWNKGGRLYSQGSNHYQQIKKARRINMRLNGVGVVEIDIVASFLTILHGTTQTPWPLGRNDDPYAIPDVPRDIAKAWLTSSLGSGMVLKKWPNKKAEDYAEETGRKLQDDFDVVAVGQAMIARLPLLGRLDSLGMDWADLMFIESEIMIAAMVDLMNQGIPSLPIHDSLLVPGHLELKAVAAIQSAFTDRAGIWPTLTVRRPDGSNGRYHGHDEALAQAEPFSGHHADDDDDLWP